jgi:outer membrane biosynthesis protein TonB/putative methionine-R-sulfoxide reductase with GAF domain
MSRSEFHPDDSPPDPTLSLEQHRLAGFPPDVALDLVFNTLVVRAAEATRANSAALALVNGDEMVCRAATGPFGPDLGATLNARDGLSGACLETRQSQLSVDTEFDPRVDPALSRRLGIRSILIVPIFDSNDKNVLTGILEVFSPSPAAFSHSDQKLLEGFAEECARIRDAGIELGEQRPAAAVAPPELVPPRPAATVVPLELVPLAFVPSEFIAASPPPVRRPPYEAWTLVLGALAILAIIAVSFLIGSRIGWLRPAPSHAQISQPIPAEPIKPADETKSADAIKSADATKSTRTKSKPAAPPKSTAAPAPAADELVVYEKGKIIFRMKSDSTKPNSARQGSDSTVEASSPNGVAATKIAATKSDLTKSAAKNIDPTQSVKLDPEEAGARLLSRTEPEYPSEAIAAHRSGNVILEVEVAEDGSVFSIRTLSGDPQSRPQLALPTLPPPRFPLPVPDECNADLYPPQVSARNTGYQRTNARSPTLCGG